MKKTEPSQLEKQGQFDESVRRNFRWNFTLNLLYGLFGTTGWQLIMAPIFVPTYMKELGGSNTMVGLLLFCGGFSRFITPPLMASLVGHEPLMKRRSVFVGSLMRSQVLLMALGGFFLSRWLNLAAFFVFFSLFNLFLGMQHVVYNMVMSKIIPVERRGRFIGLRNFLGGMSASFVGLVAGSLIETLRFPHSYAATYLLAFSLTCIGLVFFAFSREVPSPVVSEKTPLLQSLRSIPALVRGDRNFANYMLCSAVGSFALMSNPFVILYVGDKLSLSGHELGGIFFFFNMARTSVNLIFGPIADRSGFRLVFMLSVGIWAAAMVGLVLAPVTYILAIVFFVAIGAGVAGFRMSVNNMVFEFGTTAERPMRIAVVNSVSELSNAIGPLIAGVMADAISYKSIFIVSIVCTVCSLVMMRTRVTEPRNSDPRPLSS
jgi:MFS family permease